ncbi:iron transporter [Tamlana nanhaiensis]|uniref:Iron transporter n=1 Tax=Neotamlana nanhaiensis TaxID=1382798 RepID=A0A0D7W367_9FLAO|nr:divalent metal cation transporter [Tamlana nanhaiensis]KJD33541.1 iron transporter [Tamlana nanhaiensis]
MTTKLKTLGPGLLFAGAAIGVSHLVQSTRAGADFGLGLIWALLLVNIFKYPFFQFGPRYATATGESLLDGYKKLGKGILSTYFILNIATMFTIQTAVTIVTAGLASSIFYNFNTLSFLGLSINSVQIWTLIILGICIVLLVYGKYKLLDKLMKIIVITLSISTVLAVSMALTNHPKPLSIKQILPIAPVEIVFLISFMGWMPAPIDVSVWQSLWAVEKQKTEKNYTTKTALFDFNVGFVSTIVLGLGFLTLGALVMYHSGETFSNSAAIFSSQLINMYTANLGSWAYLVIGIAAFTTMFSTTLTSLDASTRAMTKTSQLLFKKQTILNYSFWITIIVLGTLSIFLFFASEMGFLVKIATILSFITAPFYAIINFNLVCSKHMPKPWRPNKRLKFLSKLGIAFLGGFSIWYLITL